MTTEDGDLLADRLPELGDFAGKLEVRLSTQLIHLLSEQMYSSPVKAVEELVVNSYDADAKECRVAIPPVDHPDEARIAVFDNGQGMDLAGLKDLWHVGASRKLEQDVSPALNRKLIGKFGIGKLATYAIAHQITYISRRGSEIYHVTCDYRLFKSNPEGGTDAVPLVVRKISDFSQLRDEVGFVALCGALGLDPKDLTNGKYATWTICLLEALKPKAADIKLGRLNWVIRTALPLRVDFKVYLNNSEVISAKEDIATVVSFAPGEIAANRIKAMNERWGTDWTPDGLGGLVSTLFPAGVRGSVIVAERSLLVGKSTDLGRSHGYFVRVRGRLLNDSDPLFGRNPVSHATFNYFRADLNIDDLNDEVTASREVIEAGDKREIVEDLLNHIFNEARIRQGDAEKATADVESRKRDGERTWVAPRLVEHPIAGVLAAAPDDGAEADDGWFYIRPGEGDLSATIDRLYKERSGYRYEYVRQGRSARMVAFDPDQSKFTLNEDHPLVGANLGNPQSQLLLEHLATAEVLLEVYMRDTGIDATVIGEILERRDTLLSSLSRDQVYSLGQVAANLGQSGDDQYDLEVNIVAAVRALGFTAKHISGKGEPDGLARFNNYVEGEKKFILEAKSSAEVPQLGTLDLATLKRHARAYDTEWCMLVAPTYPAFNNSDKGAVSINARQQKISCWLVKDLARVVEKAELLQITAVEIFDIVSTTFEPLKVKNAVDALLDRGANRTLTLQIVDVFRQIFSPGYMSEGDARTVDLVQGVLAAKGVVVNRKTLKPALVDLAAVSQGLLKINSEQIILLGDMPELERRLANVTGQAGPPRQSGTFRAGE